MSSRGVSDMTDGIVTSNHSLRGLSKKKLGLLVLVVALICAASLGFWFVSQKQDKKPPQLVPLKSGQSVSGQVYNMDKASIRKLTNEDVDPSKDIDRAHAKAIALSVSGDNTASIKLYRSIINTNNKTPHYIYYDYAIALAQANDNKGAAEAMKQAISALQNDANENKDTKIALLKLYNNKLAGFQAE